MSLIVGFYQAQLCIRGTTVAIYEYAKSNEDIFLNKSIIYYNPNHPLNNLDVVNKFKARFELVPIEGKDPIKYIEDENKIDLLYIIKYGTKDTLYSNKIPTLIHAVFQHDPHGELYCMVSRSTAILNNCKWLPHIVNPLPYKNGDKWREKHGIPESAIVYGRYGGYDTFSIKY